MDRIDASQATLASLVEELDQLREGLSSREDADLNAPNTPSRSLQNSQKMIYQTYDRLDPLQERYNEVADRIKTLSRGPLSDPLDIFPQEIWEKIISDAAFMASVPSAVANTQITDLEYILPLTLVSTRWKDAIITNPRFWNTLHLSSEINDLEAKIYTSITLARDSSLTIYIKDVDNILWLWEILGHYIISQKLRIRSLILSHHGDSDLILNSIEETPLLESLHIKLRVESSETFLGLIRSAHSIRSITGNISLSPEALKYESLKQIRILDFQDISKELLECLKRMSYLQDVTINGEMEDLSLLAGFKPLLWKNLRLSQPIRDFTAPIFQKVALTLVHLKAWVHWKHIPKFLLLCNEMVLLQSLDLQIGEFFFHKISSSQEEYVTSFQKLDLRPTTIENLSLSVINRANSIDKEVALFADLELMMPNVQHLRFSSPIIHPFLKYAYSLRSLKSLTILTVGTEDWDTEHHSLLKSEDSAALKVECLKLSTSSPFDVFTASGVIKLYVSDPIMYLTDAPQRLKLPRWENLRILEIEDTATDWENVSLPQLIEITFIHTSYAGDSVGITSLCHEIALNPHAFPSLEHLGGTVMEWDVLFIMLERRNIRVPPFKDRRLSRIQRLKLDVLPPLMILKPLTGLLGGQFTIRPSNRNISLVGIAEAVFDPAVPGCLGCHIAFHACNWKKLWKFPIDLSPYGSLFDYPDSNEQILATRAGRLEQWDSLLDKFHMLYGADDSFREESTNNLLISCNSQEPDMWAVEITEYTLHGVTVNDSTTLEE